MRSNFWQAQEEIQTLLEETEYDKKSSGRDISAAVFFVSAGRVFAFYEPAFH